MIAPNEFLGTLLHSVTAAHIMHLQTRLYPAHMALGEFYESLDDLTDGLIEAFQGKYGIVQEYPDGIMPKAILPAVFIKDLSEYVAFARKDFAEDSELQNRIDEILFLINQTLYKLTYLG